MDILKVENLTKIYGKDDNIVRALDNVSFTVKKGEFVAIIGPSGSGKSTLLHIIGGVDKPTSGKVYVDGRMYICKMMSSLQYSAAGGRTDLQFYNLIPVLNVTENITLPVLMDGRKINNERLDDSTTLSLKREDLPNQLSGGSSNVFDREIS